MSAAVSQGHSDATPTRDWLVTFARKVAEERDYSARHPGHVFLVMLHQDEAEGLLASIIHGDENFVPVEREDGEA